MKKLAVGFLVSLGIVLGQVEAQAKDVIITPLGEFNKEVVGTFLEEKDSLAKKEYSKEEKYDLGKFFLLEEEMGYIRDVDCASLARGIHPFENDMQSVWKCLGVKQFLKLIKEKKEVNPALVKESKDVYLASFKKKKEIIEPKVEGSKS